MKKLAILFTLVMCLVLGSSGAWAVTNYDVVVVDSLTGSSTSLDAVVRTDHFVSYKQGTIGIVAVPESPLVFYVYDADSTDAEALPATVIPNNNRSGVGAWKRAGSYGVSGATWLYGVIAPEAGVGVLNDFYLDTVTFNVYNKTAADAWTLVGNIKGTDGTNGYTWAIGEGVPANGTGVTRDLYLDTLTWEVYQKGDVAWASIGNIKGAAGIGITNGSLTMSALAADPADPADGDSVQWVSDGTGAGDAGDVMMKITVGATTKTVTLVDFSVAP